MKLSALNWRDGWNVDGCGCAPIFVVAMYSINLYLAETNI